MAEWSESQISHLTRSQRAEEAKACLLTVIDLEPSKDMIAPFMTAICCVLDGEMDYDGFCRQYKIPFEKRTVVSGPFLQFQEPFGHMYTMLKALWDTARHKEAIDEDQRQTWSYIKERLNEAIVMFTVILESEVSNKGEVQ